MKITKRSVNTKRHNKSFKIGGTWRSRKEAVGLAKSGKVEGVIVCAGTTGEYIRSAPGHTPIEKLDSVMHNTLKLSR